MALDIFAPNLFTKIGVSGFATCPHDGACGLG